MKTEVKPSANNKSWVWRVWECGREVAFGITFSETDAREQVQAAADARVRRLGLTWEIASRGEHER